MTDEQIVAFIIGIVMPLMISVIQRRTWPDTVRYIVALVIYLLVSLLMWLFQNHVSFDGFGWRDYLRLFAPMLIAGFSSFKLLWQPSGVATRIESATGGGA